MSGFCEQCGATLSEGAKFCAACGTKVQPRATSDEPSLAESPDAPSVAESPTSELHSRPLPFPPSSREAAGSGTTPPDQTSGDPPRRKSRRRWPYVVAAVIVVPIVIGIIAAAATGSKDKAAAVHKCSYYPKTKPRPQTCLTSLSGAPCLSYTKGSKPLDCLSTTQVVAQKKAEKRAAARARAVEKRAAARAKAAARRAAARARAQARARATAIAAANAWHKGYNEQSGAVFWKWKTGASCDVFAEYGCWHVVVITKYGCPGYVAVNANEYQQGAIINQLLDNQGYGIPPKTPRVFELDADAANVTANNVSIDCE